MGQAENMASSRANGRPSDKEGSTKMSAPASRFGMSARSPSRCNCGVTPSSAARIRSDSAVSPRPAIARCNCGYCPRSSASASTAKRCPLMGYRLPTASTSRSSGARLSSSRSVERAAGTWRTPFAIVVIRDAGSQRSRPSWRARSCDTAIIRPPNATPTRSAKRRRRRCA